MSATFKEYAALMRDRPQKFAAEDVDFHRASPGEPRCDECLHYFRRAVDGHTVCEVFRPDTVSEDVFPEWTCKFQTASGDYFPLYTDEESADMEGAKNGDHGRSESASGEADPESAA